MLLKLQFKATNLQNISSEALFKNGLYLLLIKRFAYLKYFRHTALKQLDFLNKTSVLR